MKTTVVAPICFGCLLATAFMIPRFANDPSRWPLTSVSVLPVENTSPIGSSWSFAGVEAALARIELDARGNPRLTPETEAALAEAMTALPETIPAGAWDRIEFLVRKSFPGATDAGLAPLFRDYYRYRQTELGERDALPAPRDLDAEVDRFEKTVALRRRYLGAARAERLFGRQEALARYLFALRRLEAVPGLSDRARETRRRALRAEYEKRIRAATD